MHTMNSGARFTNIIQSVRNELISLQIFRKKRGAYALGRWEAPGGILGAEV